MRSSTQLVLLCYLEVHINGKHCVYVCGPVCVCVFEGIRCGGGVGEPPFSHPEYRTRFKGSLNAIHMLPALHITFDMHKYIQIHETSTGNRGGST